MVNVPRHRGQRCDFELLTRPGFRRADGLWVVHRTELEDSVRMLYLPASMDRICAVYSLKSSMRAESNLRPCMQAEYNRMWRGGNQGKYKMVLASGEPFATYHRSRNSGVISRLSETRYRRRSFAYNMSSGQEGEITSSTMSLSEAPGDLRSAETSCNSSTTDFVVRWSLQQQRGAAHRTRVEIRARVAIISELS